MNLVILLLWLVLAYSLLYLLRFILVSHFSGLTLIILANSQLGLKLFNLLALPGVIVHELSHFLMAATLGVPTGNITIFPHSEAGEHRLGSVQIAHTDPLRESMIGAAPLIIASISLVALNRWQFPALFNPQISFIQPLAIFASLVNKFTQSQTWLWLYAVFTLSNTMFTSRSDRRAWPFLISFFLVIFVSLFGLNLVKPIQSLTVNFLTAAVIQLNIAFTLTIAVDLIVILCLSLLEQILSFLTGRRLHYTSPW